jgi:RNA polymerase sigma factor (sigma-70 family)
VAAVPSIGRAGELEQPSFAPEARLTEGLYERHHRRVFGFCLYQLRDRDDAADAVQTTFLYALGALHRGVVPSFEAPWLMAIARNVCRSRWDAGRRRRAVEFAHDPHRLAEVAPGREASDGLLGLDEALAVLPDPQRRAVLLRDWQGLSYQEVAAALGVSVSAAETLIFRGRQALARALDGEPLEEAERKRRFGLGSLLSTFKPGLLGGGVAAKVAVGTAVVGLGVTGGAILLDVSAPPSVSPPSTLPGGSPGAGLARGTPTPSRAGIAPASSLSVAPRVSRTAGGDTSARGGSPGAAASPATQAPGPAAAAVEPAGTAPGPQTVDPQAPEAGSPLPSAPVAKTTDHPVTNVTAVVAPVVGTTADAAQGVVATATPIVDTVVDTAQPVVDTASGVVNTTLAAAPPVTTPLPIPPIPPIHLP